MASLKRRAAALAREDCQTGELLQLSQTLHQEDLRAADLLQLSQTLQQEGRAGEARLLTDHMANMKRLAGALAKEDLRTSALLQLSQLLHREGRTGEALQLAEHMVALQPQNIEISRHLVQLMGAQGRTLEALERLVQLRTLCGDPQMLLADIHALIPAAVEKFNQHLGKGETEQAEAYASGLADLAPGHPALVTAALSCNQSLGRVSKAARYAKALLLLEPSNRMALAALADNCREEGDIAGETGHRFALAIAPDPAQHPLVHLHEAHYTASLLLCERLTGQTIAKVQALQALAAGLNLGTKQGSEWEAWEKHYRLLMEAPDLSSLDRHPPVPAASPPVAYASSAGAAMKLSGVQALVSRLRPEAVFFVAADAAYITRYARLYIRSVLRNAGVSCLVVVHVIGGKRSLAKTAKSTGIDDPRLIFSGDDFDAAAVTTRCYEAPPQGLVEKPVAHFQSVRFQQLVGLLEGLKLPVFVSDIDCLLQRSIKELLDRVRDADVALNLNDYSRSAGSRLTANLLFVNPTPQGMQYCRYLSHFLDSALKKPEVTRWIDQIGLLMAWHHLQMTAPGARISYFDTEKDINNVMYKSYYENPFCFLSLYQDFDMSSLDHELYG